jgi:predicted RNA-binding protein YlxR (DUF448 family)
MAKPEVKRTRKQPQRTCISCQRVLSKRELVRVVRTPSSEIVIDRTGKIAGRGAYLCPFSDCWVAAIKREAIERALQVTLSEEDVARLVEFATQLPERG